MADILTEYRKLQETSFEPTKYKSILEFGINMSKGLLIIHFREEDKFKEDKERCINDLIKIGYRIDKNDENTGEVIAIHKAIEAEYKSKSFSAVRGRQRIN